MRKVARRHEPSGKKKRKKGGYDVIKAAGGLYRAVVPLPKDTKVEELIQEERRAEEDILGVLLIQEVVVQRARSTQSANPRPYLFFFFDLVGTVLPAASLFANEEPAVGSLPDNQSGHL